MPGLGDVLDLYRQMGFYAQGGGRPSLGEKIGGLLGALGGVGQSYGQGISQYNQRQQQALQTQAMQQAQMPASQITNPTLGQASTMADIGLKQAQAGNLTLGQKRWFNTDTQMDHPITDQPGKGDLALAPQEIATLKSTRYNELLKNQQTIAGEQRKSAEKRSELTTEQQNSISSFNELGGLINGYFHNLNQLVPKADTAGDVAKNMSQAAISQIPVVGTTQAPEMAAFLKYQKAQIPIITSKMADVKRFNDAEIKMMQDALSGVSSSSAERTKNQQLLNGILNNKFQDALQLQQDKMNKTISSPMGMPQAGQQTPQYSNPAQVKADIVNGKITKDQGIQILKSQFEFQ